MGSTAYSETYTYNDSDGSLNTMTTGVGTTLTMGYDGLRRLTSVTGGPVTRQYTYRDVDSVKTTMQVASVTSGGQRYGYTYDSMGNIATFSAPGKGTVTYTYDNQGQLLKAAGDTNYTYTYDGAGNILTASDGTATHSYTYGDTNWKDLLTAFDGQAITYDAIGNPTSYFNGTRWNFTWVNGRSLATASDGTNSLSFAYDASGLRTSKTVNGTTYRYYYAGGKLMRMTWGTNTIDFFYDASGLPYAMKYNGTAYYYITNLQGDVMRIVDASQNIVTSYDYDPYGKVISATGTLAGVNPLRYRGYVYDQETGFYYLQSRYYDPTIGRFINADVYSSTDIGIQGSNMFAYCNNNPVMHSDPTGEILIGSIIAGAIGGALLSVVSHITTNPDATVGSTLLALAVGAVTGALGGAAGALGFGELGKIVCSGIVGLIAGVYAGITTDGSGWQKLAVGTSTAVITALGTYAGAHLETDVNGTRFGAAVANYSTTILVGSITEPLSVTSQNAITGKNANKKASATNRNINLRNERYRIWVQRKQGMLLGIL